MISDPRVDAGEAVLRLYKSSAQARLGQARMTAVPEQVYSWCIADIEAQAQRAIEQAEQECQTEVAQAQTAAQQAVNELRGRLEIAFARTPPATHWQDAVWQDYVPMPDAEPPWSVRVGRLLVGTEDLGSLPALAGLAGTGHLFVQSDTHYTQQALQLLQSIALRVIVSAPPDSVRLVLADPRSAGANLAIFRRLPESLRGAKIWSNAQEIAAQLLALTEHIEHVIQDRLVSPDLTFETYNLSMPEQRVRYQVLVLTDFPSAFSEEMVERLVHIARNGPRAGVYLVVHLDTSQPLPRDFQIEHLTSCGTTLRFTYSDQLTWDDPLFGRYPVVPDHLPSSAQVESLLVSVGSASARATSDLDYSRIAIASQEQWRGSSLAGLKVPIGITGSGAVHYLQIGQDPGVVHHGLIGGTTGSGKGNLLHVLITQLALCYAPEELGLYLLDFKEGVEFQRYLALPHARAVALESEREFGLSVLRHLQGEMEERGRLFKRVGAGITKLAEYREQSGVTLPRLLLIIDEFQVLFKDDDALSRTTAQILEDLAKRGRSAAIHVVLCSQSPATGGQVLSRIYDQMGLRIALQCRTRDAYAILGDGNDAAARLERVGEAIYNDMMGDKEKNRIIRVARLREPDWRHAQRALSRLAGERQYPQPVTFDGRAPAHVEQNAALMAALAQPGWPATGRAPRIWLGAPVDMKPPTGAPLERHMRSNLLIAGDDQAQAYGVVMSVLLSIAAQLGPADAQFIIVDLSRTDSPFAGYFADLAAMPDRTLIPHDMLLADQRRAGAIVDDLLARLAERLAGAASEPRLIMFVVGLHRWRDLRGPDTLTQSEGAKRLMRLAEEGPEAGINLVVWADGLSAVESVFKRGGFRHFDLRVALRLSLRDSTELLGNSAAASLGDNRALFRHEDWELGRQEKFKPYLLPERKERDRLLGLLRSKVAEKGSTHGI